MKHWFRMCFGVSLALTFGLGGLCLAESKNPVGVKRGHARSEERPLQLPTLSNSLLSSLFTFEEGAAQNMEEWDWDTAGGELSSWNPIINSPGAQSFWGANEQATVGYAFSHYSDGSELDQWRHPEDGRQLQGGMIGTNIGLGHNLRALFSVQKSWDLQQRDHFLPTAEISWFGSDGASVSIGQSEYETSDGGFGAFDGTIEAVSGELKPILVSVFAGAYFDPAQNEVVERHAGFWFSTPIPGTSVSTSVSNIRGGGSTVFVSLSLSLSTLEFQ